MPPGRHHACGVSRIGVVVSAPILDEILQEITSLITVEPNSHIRGFDQGFVGGCPNDHGLPPYDFWTGQCDDHDGWLSLDGEYSGNVWWAAWQWDNRQLVNVISQNSVLKRDDLDLLVVSWQIKGEGQWGRLNFREFGVGIGAPGICKIPDMRNEEN